jgi:hypothetical protein
MQVASIVITFMGESAFSNSSDSQDSLVPNTMNRLRWAARRVIWGKYKSSGTLGMLNNLRLSSSPGK